MKRSAPMHTVFPAGRGEALRGRGVTAVLGPTNTGKTHLAIERMLAHEVGIIGLPLRLLAREVYDKVAARIGPSHVALITGEEKIKPPGARYYICTVEAMPLDIEADFVAVDEIQLAADDERGHIFTERLFNCRGLSETLMLGAATMRDAIRDLLPGANLVSRPRLSKLSYAGDKKITRLPRRTAIVAFSANEVYAIAELVRRQRGGAAVVLGALSPRTRNAQVGLYQNGDVDFLVATDAIGMGLNLNLDHVAFAGIRKFDGLSHRNLRAAELGQIAGRAGRHMNDGTFGVTGQVAPFDPELVTALEDHHFDQVTTLQWRNRKLDYGSIERLKESLRVTPDHPRLTRARMVDDVIALENVSLEENVRDIATAPAAIGLLWEMCQVPDYRKISAASHAELIATLYGFVMSSAARIPSDWFAQQVERCDRTDGDIDTLSSRLSQIRTWTFVSHRAQWLEDPDYWQGRSREIEDSLSDALHERLALRFVDRRTAVLMRRLRDKEDLVGEVGADGKVLVENHYVGQLQGFLFIPDAGGEGIHGKAARQAATEVVTQELSARAAALAAADDASITLSPNGRILWQGAEIGRLEAGDTALKPRFKIIAGEHLLGPDQERLAKRLEDWLQAHLKARIEPLIALRDATDLSGLARGFAFRLTENFGVLRRDSLAAEVKALDQAARRQLRQYGIRFGAFNIYMPALLKPGAAELLLLLWALHDGRSHNIDVDHLPERPRHGLTSVEMDPSIPMPFWHAAGFHVAGGRAVRIDMLERLSDLIRQRVSWRELKVEPPTEAAAPDAPVPEKVEGAPSAAKLVAIAIPSGATGDGGFRVVPELMSVVGCSGEDFASILKALGFRCERRKLPQQPAPALPAEDSEPTAETGTEAAAAAALTDAPVERVEPMERFDEIWRPGRRNEPRPHRTQREGRPRQRGPQAEQRQRPPAGESGNRQQAKPGWRKHARTGSGQEGAERGKSIRGKPERENAGAGKPERNKPDAGPSKYSPFAALEELRRSMMAREGN